MKKSLEECMLKVSTFNILWMTMCLVIPSILYFFHITIHSFSFPLILIVTFIIYIFVYGEKKKISIECFLLFGLVLVVSLLLSYFVFNIHWDGNTYHKTAIGMFSDGWNPLNSDCTSVVDADKLTDGIHYNAQWINHYANGGWIISAVWSSFFHNIEIGKAVNIINVFSLFFLLYWFFCTKLTKKRNAALIAAAACFNPITVSEITSFYIDGNLYLYLLLGVLAMILLSDSTCKLPKKYSLMYLFASVVYCANIKFTGLPYIAFFCMGFYFCWLYIGYRKKNFKTIFLQSTGLFAFLAVFSVCIVGYSSYVCNTIEEGHPMHPLMGKNKIDIMAYSEPNTFENKSGVEKSLISLFSKTEHITNSSSKEPQLKIPFTISVSEIKDCIYTDVRIGGFGPWFSGILIIAVVLSILFLKEARKKNPIITLELSVVLAISMLMLLFFPSSWWARYSCYIYFYVIIALFYLCKKAENKQESTIRGIAQKTYAFLICINTLFFILAPAAGAYISLDIWKEKKELQKLAQNNNEIIVYCPTKQMTGIFWNLKDWEISFSASDDRIPEGTSIFNDKIIYTVK